MSSNPLNEDTLNGFSGWEVLSADFDGWNEQIAMIIDAADRDGCFRWALHDRPSVMRWSSARRSSCEVPAAAIPTQELSSSTSP